MKKLAVLLAFAACGACALPVLAGDERIGVMSRNPSISPTTNEVVFAADFDAPQSLWRLYVSALDGSAIRRLATSPTSVSDETPAWSPDGALIAFSSNNGVNSDIWTIAADGALKQLTSQSLNNMLPVWTPDSKGIVFVSDRGGSKDIWIMNADGSGVARLTSLPDQENHPSVSPDGTKVVFSLTTDTGASLMTINIDGTNLRQLTPPAADINDWNPSWGKYGILFSSNRDPASGNYRIWVIQPDGSGMRKVGDVIGLDPIWSPDGKILFTDEVSGTSALAAVSLLDPATGQKRVVANVLGYQTAIDIRPGKTPNFVNPRSHGRISVAILSKTGFDAVAAVDQKMLRFGRTGTENSLRRCFPRGIDVNGDNLPDLVCRFSIPESNFQQNDRVGILRFLTKDGIPLEGRDAITIRRDDDDDDFRHDD